MTNNKTQQDLDRKTKRLKNAARLLSSKGASKGGQKRWEGKTEEERKAHARMMVEARRKKKV